jgi:hypothetical protein
MRRVLPVNFDLLFPLGMTKTAAAYRLKGNPPQVHK